MESAVKMEKKCMGKRVLFMYEVKKMKKNYSEKKTAMGMNIPTSIKTFFIYN
jgi:hypothetical protein